MWKKGDFLTVDDVSYIPIIISLNIGCTERQDDEEKRVFLSTYYIMQERIYFKRHAEVLLPIYFYRRRHFIPSPVIMVGYKNSHLI